MKAGILGLVLSSLVALSEAKQYNFNVVSILGEGSSLGVKYGDNVSALTANHFPLFSGSVEADNITQYKYVSLNSNGEIIEEETIERTYSEENSKINEVFNRTTRDLTVSDLPQPFQPMFPMGSEKLHAFPKNVIYNIYAKCDEEGYYSLSNIPFLSGDPFGTGIATQNNASVNCTITIVSPDNTYESDGSIHLIGFGSRLYKKLTWALKFDKKFLGRKAVKLRAMASDPTLVRENLATEFYKSMGLPVQEGTYARLFINGDTYGLYTIMDSFSKKWLASYVHGDPKKDIGMSYKLYVASDNYPNFKYISDDYTDYSAMYIPDEYEDKDVDINNEASLYTRLLEFIKLFNDWNNSPNRSVDDLKKFFNIEACLRLMAMDTLTLALDNFYIRFSNAALYYNPDKQNYVILPYDFDKVMGGTHGYEILDEATYLTDCYTWANQHEEVIDHFLTNALLSQPEIKARYDIILAKTTRELFNRDVINNYVNEIAELIKEDIQWNFEEAANLNTEYEGYVNHFTYQDFEGNLDDTPVLYNKEINKNDAPFGVKQWVEVRGGNCQQATADVDISKDKNISDDEKVDTYSASPASFTTNFTLLLVLSQFILFLFF